MKMQDKDKLWIVCYLDVRGINKNDIPLLLYRATIDLNDKFDETVQALVVPIQGKNKVECIFDPTHGSNEKYDEFFEKANEYIKNLTKKEE